MRRYRFGEANGAAGWLKRSNILYFVMAWNAFGFCCYQYWVTRKNKDNPEWHKLTFAQKYISYMADPDDSVTVVSMAGFRAKDIKETNMGEYLKPKPSVTKANPDQSTS